MTLVGGEEYLNMADKTAIEKAAESWVHHGMTPAPGV